MHDLLALLYAMFHCAFVTFQYGVLGKVWSLIVSIPDLSFLSKSLVLLEITIQLTGAGVEHKHNPYNNLPQEDGHNISHNNQQLASQVDYNASHRETDHHPPQNLTMTRPLRGWSQHI